MGNLLYFFFWVIMNLELAWGGRFVLFCSIQGIHGMRKMCVCVCIVVTIHGQGFNNFKKKIFKDSVLSWLHYNKSYYSTVEKKLISANYNITVFIFLTIFNSSGDLNLNSSHEKFFNNVLELQNYYNIIIKIIWHTKFFSFTMPWLIQGK